MDQCAVIGGVLVVPLDCGVLFWDMASDLHEVVAGDHIGLTEFHGDSAVTFLPMAKA